MRKITPAPYEILAAIWVIVAYVTVHNLPVYLPVLETFRQALKSYGIFLLVSFATIAISLYVRHRREKTEDSAAAFRDLRSAAKRVDLWLAPLRITLSIVATIVFHFLLKSTIFLINPRVWDEELMNLDRALHFGISPSLFLIELFKNPYFLQAMDIFYSVLYGMIVLLYPPIFVGISRPRLRDTFSTAFVLVFIIGIVGYVAIPSWGPVFVDPQEFEETLQSMPMTVKVQSQLYKETSSLVRNPMGSRTIAYGGAAAFPSLHVAIFMLFALTSRRLSKRWFRINIVFVAFMVLGSVITGYHYLVDSYVGLLLGWAVYKISDIWAGRAYAGLEAMSSIPRISRSERP